MDIVKEGDKVQLEYELKLEDGTTCFKNQQDKFLVITVGKGEIFTAVENKIKDMKQGESKTVTLKPKDAFGIYNENLVAEIPKKNIVDHSKLKIGSNIQMKTTSDKIIKGTIIDPREVL